MTERPEERDSLLPTVDDFTGSDPDITGDLTLQEHMDNLRGGQHDRIAALEAEVKELREENADERETNRQLGELFETRESRVAQMEEALREARDRVLGTLKDFDEVNDGLVKALTRIFEEVKQTRNGSRRD